MASTSNQNNEGDKPVGFLKAALSPPKESQIFHLALIIIFAYVVFFAWIIASSPVNTDSTGKKSIDYAGMSNLTATFGIIAAAVVGYYFGQRNLEQASKSAEIASKVAEDKKVALKNEKKDRLLSIEKAIPIYKDAEKFVTLAENTVDKNVLDNIKKQIDVDSLKKGLKNRITEVEGTAKTKGKEIIEES